MSGRWWVGLSAAGVLCLSGNARAECTRDLDCQGELVCEASECVAAASVPAPVAAPTPTPQAKPAATRFKHPVLLVAGIVTTTVGLVGTVAGNLGSGSCRDVVNTDQETNCRVAQDARTSFTLIGLALVVAGVPMLLVGTKREPVPTVSVAPWVSHQHGGLQLQLRL
jgi:hypothetical protein